jgi:hypothetical protein
MHLNSLLVGTASRPRTDFNRRETVASTGTHADVDFWHHTVLSLLCCDHGPSRAQRQRKKNDFSTRNTRVRMTMRFGCLFTHRHNVASECLRHALDVRLFGAGDLFAFQAVCLQLAFASGSTRNAAGRRCVK